jgi:ribosomal protein S18 acetylase RimI-like enzyme
MPEVGVSGDVTIVELTQDTQIAPLLEMDRGWAAYALCDLEPPYRPDARYFGALRAGATTAIVLVYAPPSFTSLLPCGDPEGVQAILAEARDLPPSPVLLAQRRMLQAIEYRYHIGPGWTMLRMVVASGELRPAPASGATIARLSAADLPALLDLYAAHPDSVFTPFMFEHGVYFGAIVDGALAAVAGTHAIARRYGIGVIGNVFTHPDYRGRGLATAVTGAVTQALIDEGASLVALNVREDNMPAIRAYAHVGFAVHEPFWEGEATLLAGT